MRNRERSFLRGQGEVTSQTASGRGTSVVVDVCGTCISLPVAKGSAVWAWIRGSRRQRGIVGTHQKAFIQENIQGQARFADRLAGAPNAFLELSATEMQWAAHLRDLSAVPQPASRDGEEAVAADLRKVIAPPLVPVEPDVSFRWETA